MKETLPSKLILRNIPGFPGYKADNDSCIWSFKRNPYGVKLKLRIHNNYSEIGLCVSGKRHYSGVHRLVCLAFHGEPVHGQETCHINGNTMDNHPSNLRWGSTKENMQDRIRLGTQKGSLNGNAILTQKKVLDIRLRSSHVSNKLLAQEYTVDPSTISDIIRNKTWKDVS